MKNILAPIDFSDITDEVIDIAGRFAMAFSAKLWIIHVAAPDPEFVGYDIGPQHEREWRADVLREEHKTIQEKVQELERNGTEEVQGLLVQGPTQMTILQEAEKVNADLIIVGSHGHGAVFKLLMGSVCEELIKKASCPILVIPSHKDKKAETCHED